MSSLSPESRELDAKLYPIMIMKRSTAGPRLKLFKCVDYWAHVMIIMHKMYTDASFMPCVVYFEEDVTPAFNCVFACKHSMCKSCFKDWVQQAATCPMCRAPIPQTLEEISSLPEGIPPINTTLLWIESLSWLTL